MNDLWPKAAEHMATGLGVKPGELVQVRDGAGRPEILEEVLLAVELTGATPLPELISPSYMRRMLSGATTDYLSRWDHKRQAWMHQTDRVLDLQGAELDESGVPTEKLRAWQEAAHRLTVTEEDIGPLPFSLVAIPTQERAMQLGMSLKELEARVLPALLASTDELRAEIRNY